MEPSPPPHRFGRATGQIAVGVVILAIGLALAGDRLLDRDVALMPSLWPVLLLIMGAARLTFPPADRGPRRSHRSGVWLVLVGCWGLVSEAHLFGLTYRTSWPLLVTAAGVMLVWRALEGGAEPRLEREQRP